jgi:hypothetical protein
MSNKEHSPAQAGGLIVPSLPQQEWKGYEKIAFRFFFIYFFIQAVPLDWKYFSQLFSINWGSLHYGDIFNLAHYAPHFYQDSQSYANWAIVALIALIGTAAWTLADRNKTKEYSVLYYWIRVIVRYRLAIGIIAYGIIKFFPLQAPYPSISNLNTAYGDFTRWKLFSLSLGVVPAYELFLGLMEIIFGLLLLFRKTATIGAFLIIVFTGNVFVSNIAYEGGEQVYSLYLITLALFIVFFDLQRILSLLVWQKPTAPNTFKPVFTAAWLKYSRLAFKIGVVLFFVVLYGFKTATTYKSDPYQFPTTKGLAGTSGVYNVAEFRLNNDSIPYSKTDLKRWQDVVFETWNTISIKSNRPVIIDSTNTDKVYKEDDKRTYELEGSAGRHYYSYTADTINHLLTLHNKNKNYKGETLQLRYEKAANNQLILSGTDQNKDSVYVVLDKLNKKYLLQEAAKVGRRAKLKL